MYYAWAAHIFSAGVKCQHCTSENHSIVKVYLYSFAIALYVSFFVLLRNDSHVMGSIEKAIIRGLPVLLKNSDDHSDSVVAPLIHHRNTALETHVAEGKLLSLMITTEV